MKIMSNAEYHLHPAISKSGLDQIAKSPAHYKLYKNVPRETTDAMEFGTAFHTYLLEPELFEKQYLVVEGMDKRTKLYKELVAQNPDKTIISGEALGVLSGMKAEFGRNSTVSRVLDNALVERSIFWKDAVTGVDCRCRPDIIFGDDILIDLKTTTDAKEYSRSAFKYRAHVQAAMYMAGYFAQTGIRPKEFLFITIEKSAPFGIITHRASEEFIARGMKEMNDNLAVYARCLETDQWPCYPEAIQDLSLPPWVI